MSKDKQGKGTLPKSATWRHSLFEHALEGIFRSTPEGRFLDVNPALVRMLGYQSAEEVLALKLPDDLYANPVERERLRAHYEGMGVVDGKELQWKKKNGESIIVVLYAWTLRNTQGRIIGYEGMVVDVTERKRTEAALQTSEAKYRTIFAASPDFIYLTDSEGRILDANPALLEWQGLSLEELRQRHFLDFFDGGNLEEVRWKFAALRQGLPVRGLEVRAHNERGESRVFEVNATSFQEPAGVAATLSVARDITTRKQTEERLRLLSRQLLETQEVERRHLARELHDEIGQTLFALKVNLLALRPIPKEIMLHLQESFRIVDSLLRQIRNISLDLRPSQLDNLGLVDTLQWYVDWQAQRLGLVAHFFADSLRPRPNPALETACFRIVQEAVTNIGRHAQAHRFWVELRCHDAALLLLVRDDGVGFDLEAARTQAAKGKGLGLLGIEERVRLVSGQLKIVTASGAGTEIHVRVPLKHSP